MIFSEYYKIQIKRRQIREDVCNIYNKEVKGTPESLHNNKMDLEENCQTDKGMTRNSQGENKRQPQNKMLKLIKITKMQMQATVEHNFGPRNLAKNKTPYNASIGR